MYRLRELPASSLSSSPSHKLSPHKALRLAYFIRQLSPHKALRLAYFIRHATRTTWHRSFTTLHPLVTARDSSPDAITELSNRDNLLGRPGDAAGSSCIIEGPETVQDFAKLQLQEILDNIKSRRNKIFLLMEEVRRLRIQQRLKSGEHAVTNEDENEMPNFPSFIPFLPSLTTATLKQYYVFYFGVVAAIIVFGGFLAPIKIHGHVQCKYS